MVFWVQLLVVNLNFVLKIQVLIILLLSLVQLVVMLIQTNQRMTIQPLFTRTFLVVCDNVTFNSEAVTIYSLGTLAN